MINLAILKAGKMGIKLYSSEGMGISGFEEEGFTKLYNKKSRSSHVYTDAGSGLRRDGKFVVNDVFRIG